jgi:uncharacterized protein YqfB (UPF0267 family)
MKERGILFQAPLVRAILAGQKTVTRRLMKPQPMPIPDDVERVKPYDDSGFWWLCDKVRSAVSMHDAPCLGPYGYKGDRLWVRETWATLTGNGIRTVYRADGEDPRTGWDDTPAERRPAMIWRPSIFMPRKASRITLEVTSVRVERVNEISEEDAKAEGVTPLTGVAPEQQIISGEGRTQGTHPYTLAFAVLWDTINDKDGCRWVDRPWVWVVGFRRLP